MTEPLEINGLSDLSIREEGFSYRDGRPSYSYVNVINRTRNTRGMGYLEIPRCEKEPLVLDPRAKRPSASGNSESSGPDDWKRSPTLKWVPKDIKQEIKWNSFPFGLYEGEIPSPDFWKKFINDPNRVWYRPGIYDNMGPGLNPFQRPSRLTGYREYRIWTNLLRALNRARFLYDDEDDEI